MIENNFKLMKFFLYIVSQIYNSDIRTKLQHEKEYLCSVH